VALVNGIEDAGDDSHSIFFLKFCVIGQEFEPLFDMGQVTRAR